MEATGDQREQLLAAVEQLYVAFRPYHFNREMHFCECLAPDEVLALLKSRPLRQLTWNELSDYESHATNGWGDDRDFRHFLPRILELLALESTQTPTWKN